MQVGGRCHCGNIALRYTVEPAPVDIPARACTCSFCVKHGGVWTSSPRGTLVVTIQDIRQVNHYAFATKTATFHVCRACGVVPFVTSEVDGRDYAVVSVNALEGLPESMLRRGSATFDGEGELERLARRVKNWIPDVRYAAGGVGPARPV